jgi:hypothetical protein
MGQEPPGTTSAHEIQDGVDDLQTLVFGGPPATVRHGNQRFKALPSLHSQVTRIRLSSSASVIHVLFYYTYPILSCQYPAYQDLHGA